MRNLIPMQPIGQGFNLLKTETSFEKDVTFNDISGVATFEITTESYKKTKAVKVTNIRFEYGEDAIFNFGSLLQKTIAETGIYTFSLALKSDKDVTLKADVYVNSALISNNELVAEISENEDYKIYAQTLTLTAGDALDVQFTIVGDDTKTGTCSVWIDALMLENDRKVSNYAYPISKQIAGVYDYNNNGGSQSFTGTDLKLNNTGLGTYTNKDFSLIDVAEIFNTTTNQFDFSKLNKGDIVRLRIDADLTTTTNNQIVSFYVRAGIGSGSEYSVSSSKMFLKSSGTHANEMNYIELYIGNDITKNYPAELKLTSDANCTILLNGFAIFVTKIKL